MIYKKIWIEKISYLPGGVRFVVMTPDIERYFLTINSAKKWLRIKRKLNGIKRRAARKKLKMGF